jgi:RimJ/RimL family protein N-acetyltransferase
MAELVAETERLRLRTWDFADRAEFVRHCNTPEVTRFVGGVQSEEEYTAAFERIERSQREFGHCFWLVERKADGALLGFCGLKRAALEGTLLDGAVEIGWRLREDVWRQGFALEAAKAALEWAWANLDADRVVAITIPANEPSWRLMERLGMARRRDLDFAHPMFAPDHPLSRHIAYVMDRPA